MSFDVDGAPLKDDGQETVRSIYLNLTSRAERLGFREGQTTCESFSGEI